MSRLRRAVTADRPLSCREVGRVLQRYLDGHVDAPTAEKVGQHLEDCRRCGLDITVYREIKASLASRSPEISEDSLARLRRFGERLIDNGHGDAPPDPPSDPGSA
jgi:anti-sigma factor RsiW